MSSSKHALTILLQLYLFSQYLEVKFIFDQTLFKVFPDLYIMTRQPDTYFFFLFFLTFRPAQTVLGTVSKSAQRKCGYRPRLSLSLSACLPVCMSVYLTISFCAYPSVCLSVSFSVCLSVCVSLSLSVSVSVCLCISFCHPSTSQSYLSVCLSPSLSLLICLSPSLVICPSIYLSSVSVFVSVCVSVCLSVCLSVSLLLLLLCPLHLE